VLVLASHPEASGAKSVGECRNAAQQPQQRLGPVGLHWSQHAGTCYPMAHRDRHSPTQGHQGLNVCKKTLGKWPGRIQRAKWPPSARWRHGHGQLPWGRTCHLRDVPSRVPRPARRGAPQERLTSSAPRAWQLPQGSGSCNPHARLQGGALGRPAALPLPIPVLPTIAGSSRLSLSIRLCPCSASGTNSIPTAASPGPKHLPWAQRSGSRGLDRQILEQHLAEVCLCGF